MHELAIAESVVEAVRARTHERTVSRVRLRVGQLSGVVPDALTFSFDLATAGTSLEGAVLDIVNEAGLARCRTCSAEFTLPDLILLCPCGSADVEVVSGRDLQIVSVDLWESTDTVGADVSGGTSDTEDGKGDLACAAPVDAEKPKSG
jgi:hydrogenase nickel incorporation protein HypA/HybF